MSAPTFDQEKVYDTEIAPLMTQIIEICKRVDMPFIASFAYAYDPKDEEKQMAATSYSPGPGKWPHPRMLAALKAIRSQPSFSAFTITTK